MNCNFVRFVQFVQRIRTGVSGSAVLPILNQARATELRFRLTFSSLQFCLIVHAALGLLLDFFVFCSMHRVIYIWVYIRMLADHFSLLLIIIFGLLID